MSRSRFPYPLLLLTLALGCAASTRVEDFDVRERWIYSGGDDVLYREQDGRTLGTVRSGDTLQVVASVVNDETGDLLYYLVDHNGERARVRAPLLRRDPPPTATRVDSSGAADSLARKIYTDGKGLRYYIDQEGNKVYVQEPAKPSKKRTGVKRPKKKKRK